MKIKHLVFATVIALALHYGTGQAREVLGARRMTHVSRQNTMTVSTMRARLAVEPARLWLDV